jgi:hypothetical protein
LLSRTNFRRSPVTSTPLPYDKHSVGGSGMNDQVRRAISASGYSGSNAVRDVETLDDLATLVRKEVHDYVQRAAQ